MSGGTATSPPRSTSRSARSSRALCRPRSCSYGHGHSRSAEWERHLRPHVQHHHHQRPSEEEEEVPHVPVCTRTSANITHGNRRRPPLVRRGGSGNDDDDDTTNSNPNPAGSLAVVVSTEEVRRPPAAASAAMRASSSSSPPNARRGGGDRETTAVAVVAHPTSPQSSSTAAAAPPATIGPYALPGRGRIRPGRRRRRRRCAMGARSGSAKTTKMTKSRNTTSSGGGSSLIYSLLPLLLLWGLVFDRRGNPGLLLRLPCAFAEGATATTATSSIGDVFSAGDNVNNDGGIVTGGGGEAAADNTPRHVSNSDDGMSVGSGKFVLGIVFGPPATATATTTDDRNSSTEQQQAVVTSQSRGQQQQQLVVESARVLRLVNLVAAHLHWSMTSQFGVERYEWLDLEYFPAPGGPNTLFVGGADGGGFTVRSPENKDDELSNDKDAAAAATAAASTSMVAPADGDGDGGGRRLRGRGRGRTLEEGGGGTTTTTTTTTEEFTLESSVHFSTQPTPSPSEVLRAILGSVNNGDHGLLLQRVRNLTDDGGEQQQGRTGGGFRWSDALQIHAKPWAEKPPPQRPTTDPAPPVPDEAPQSLDSQFDGGREGRSAATWPVVVSVVLGFVLGGTMASVFAWKRRTRGGVGEGGDWDKFDNGEGGGDSSSHDESSFDRTAAMDESGMTPASAAADLVGRISTAKKKKKEKDDDGDWDGDAAAGATAESPLRGEHLVWHLDEDEEGAGAGGGGSGRRSSFPAVEVGDDEGRRGMPSSTSLARSRTRLTSNTSGGRGGRGVWDAPSPDEGCWADDDDDDAASPISQFSPKLFSPPRSFSPIPHQADDAGKSADAGNANADDRRDGDGDAAAAARVGGVRQKPPTGPSSTTSLPGSVTREKDHNDEEEDATTASYHTAANNSVASSSTAAAAAANNPTPGASTSTSAAVVRRPTTTRRKRLEVDAAALRDVLPLHPPEAAADDDDWRLRTSSEAAPARGGGGRVGAVNTREEADDDPAGKNCERRSQSQLPLFRGTPAAQHEREDGTMTSSRAASVTSSRAASEASFNNDVPDDLSFDWPPREDGYATAVVINPPPPKTDEHVDRRDNSTGGDESFATANDVDNDDHEWVSSPSMAAVSRLPSARTINEADLAAGGDHMSHVSTPTRSTVDPGEAVGGGGGLGGDGAFPSGGEHASSSDNNSSSPRGYRRGFAASRQNSLASNSSRFYLSSASSGLHPLDWSFGDSSGTVGDNTLDASTKASETSDLEGRAIWDQYLAEERVKRGREAKEREMIVAQFPSPLGFPAPGGAPAIGAAASFSTGVSSTTCGSSQGSVARHSRDIINDILWLERKIADRSGSVGSLISEDFADHRAGRVGGGAVSPPAPLPVMQSIVCRDCHVPPGRQLGMVVRSTKDGPSVHAVEGGGGVEGQLFRGDLIIAVDNVDTRGMTADQAMNLLNARASMERKITVLHFGDKP